MAATVSRKAINISASISPLLNEYSRLKISDVKPSSLLMLKRMAGHSHWANIKFKKSNIDVARSKMFGRLAVEMITAVREGGAEKNPRLDNIVTRAKAVSMPKASIENAIKSGLGNKDNPLSQILLEARGPGACGLLIDILTTNKVKAKIDMNTILKRNGGTMKDGGTVQFQYESKGVVTVDDFLHTDQSNTENYPEQNMVEKAEEIAIEAGAEDVYFTQLEDSKRVIKFVCPFQEMKNLSEDITSFIQTNSVIHSTGLEYYPTLLTTLSENQMDRADRLIDLILNHSDVIRVYDNIKDYPSSTCKLFVDTLTT
ncbi:hypothetical protein QZH41_015106 [Actinostola sp. cb2023]|nr:hypothetical protein QZH41_015106 [Actinostola sp. cb2023]